MVSWPQPSDPEYASWERDVMNSAILLGASFTALINAANGRALGWSCDLVRCYGWEMTQAEAAYKWLQTVHGFNMSYNREEDRWELFRF